MLLFSLTSGSRPRLHSVIAGDYASDSEESNGDQAGHNDAEKG